MDINIIKIMYPNGAEKNGMKLDTYNSICPNIRKKIVDYLSNGFMAKEASERFGVNMNNVRKIQHDMSHSERY